MGRVTFATDELRDKFKGNEDYSDKINEIVDRATAYGKEGPKNLGSDVKHCHITDQVGIAWRYLSGAFKNPKQEPFAEILALGRKNEKAKPGNSGYEWSKKGDI